MTYTAPNKPVAGEPLRASLVGLLIDNGADANSRLEKLEGFGDSFENDTDADDSPDGWSVAAYSGGTYSLDATEAVHGGQSFKVVTANPGGYVELTHEASQIVPVAMGEPLGFSWFLQSSDDAVDPEVQVSVLWYDAADAYVSTEVLYKTGTMTVNGSLLCSIPEEWMLVLREAVVPATAVYFRLKFRLGSSAITSAVSVGVDQVRVGRNRMVFMANETLTEVGINTSTQYHFFRLASGGPLGFDGPVMPHWGFVKDDSSTDLVPQDVGSGDPWTYVQVCPWFDTTGAGFVWRCNDMGIVRGYSAGTGGGNLVMSAYYG